MPTRGLSSSQAQPKELRLLERRGREDLKGFALSYQSLTSEPLEANRTHIKQHSMLTRFLQRIKAARGKRLRQWRPLTAVKMQREFRAPPTTASQAGRKQPSASKPVPSSALKSPQSFWNSLWMQMMPRKGGERAWEEDTKFSLHRGCTLSKLSRCCFAPPWSVNHLTWTGVRGARSLLSSSKATPATHSCLAHPLRVREFFQMSTSCGPPLPYCLTT